MVESDSTGPRAVRANATRTPAAAVAIALLAACSGAKQVHHVEALDPELPDAGASAPPAFPDTGINASTLTVTGIKPDGGPFAGGNQAIVRGSGFSEDALVFIGGHLVQPADTIMLDRNSLRVVVPAGRAGRADVRVEVGDRQATKPDAYVYSSLLLEPARGSIAGGTSVLITLDQPSFDAAAQVEFGAAACTDLRVITPSQARCKTPPGSVGAVDVRVSWPEPSARAALDYADGFEYLDLTDTDHGGLSGEPVRGTLNVSVVDSFAGLAVPDAFVLVGDDPAGEYQGVTDARGQITFSGADLAGPVTVHVSAECMERASIVEFDAENVTIHVTPLLDPKCAELGELPSGRGRGIAGSLISGELIFPGSNEFSVNGWDVVPPPRADEVRVAYVFTTRSSLYALTPSPGVGGAHARVVENGEIGVNGYPYSIFARPAGLAVYALSGLERRDTGEFTPYVMGVARDVLTAPGEETAGVDIHMNITLDRELQVALTNLPTVTPRGPFEFRVQAHIDLGGEGVMVRQVNGYSTDFVSSYADASLFRFFAQPALIGSLSDARYQVVAGWYSDGSGEMPPYTEVVRRGVNQTETPLVIEDLLAIPLPTSPLLGARLPEDRVLRWSQAGPQPDLYLVEIVGGDNFPAWSQIVPGTQSESPIPDLSQIEGLSDIAPGVIGWTVRAIRVEDFAYNRFNYDLLARRSWTHTSFDTFHMQR